MGDYRRFPEWEQWALQKKHSIPTAWALGQRSPRLQEGEGHIACLRIDSSPGEPRGSAGHRGRGGSDARARVPSLTQRLGRWASVHSAYGLCFCAARTISGHVVI